MPKGGDQLDLMPADMCIGLGRFATGGKRKVLYIWHALGNRVLSLLLNMLNGINLTDMETCYKAFYDSLTPTFKVLNQILPMNGISTIVIIRKAHED